MSASHASDFRSRVESALNAGIIIGDGHSLFAPEFYAPYFTVEELAKADLIKTVKSDGTLKGTIFDRKTGQPVDVLEGVVYNLLFLGWVARTLGVTRYAESAGRGSAACEYVGFIKDALAE